MNRPSLRNHCASLFGCAALLCMVAAAFAAPGQASRLRVLASFFPPACVALNLAGPLAEVEVLLDGRADPHDTHLSRTDLQKITRADLIVINGLGMETWLERAMRQTAAQKPVVALAKGLTEDRLLRGESPHVHGPGGAGPEHHGHETHGEAVFNPHVWLDPLLLAAGVTNVLRALQALDPVHAADYASNAAAFVLRLHRLDADLTRELGPVRGSPIVTTHDAFHYFARRYGLDVIGVLEPVAEVDPSPRYLVELSRRVREKQARALFEEPGSPTMLARRLAADWSVARATLDTLEAGPLRNTAYEEAMRANALTLRETLLR